VPAPIQITDHVGDTGARDLLSEVLTLTKMNWNSARFAERRPVPVRFADEVGTILRDLPEGFTPEARYAF
jgi:argonaute-like protein implicated in RNA metabolism and viral defense